MHPSILFSAIAVIGTITGAIVTNFFNKQAKEKEIKNNLIMKKIVLRETLYSEYLKEIYEQAMMPFSSKKEISEAFSPAIAISSRISLISSELGRESTELIAHVISMHMKDENKNESTEMQPKFVKLTSALTTKFREDIDSLNNQLLMKN